MHVSKTHGEKILLKSTGKWTPSQGVIKWKKKDRRFAEEEDPGSEKLDQQPPVGKGANNIKPGGKLAGKRLVGGETTASARRGGGGKYYRRAGTADFATSGKGGG